MRCRACGQEAIIDLARHHAGFCAEHFQQLCRRQVTKAIDDFAMLTPGQPVLVAVSGGKDSLALWDLLVELGYRAEGLYLGLGIGDYSDASGEVTRRFAAQRNLVLHEVELRDEHGFDVPTAAAATRRVPCSSCGLAKRHLFNTEALSRGFDVVATGHNLDDEAAVLFGNTLRWDLDSLARQSPVLPARPGFPKRIKPLMRLSERETAAWCVVRGIDYLVDECPMAEGNRHLGYKEALNRIEATSPGTKASFYLSFLEHMAPRLAGDHRAVQAALGECGRCGAPTTGEICAFCRLVETASAHEPVPVEVLTTRRTRGRRRS